MVESNLKVKAGKSYEILSSLCKKKVLGFHALGEKTSVTKNDIVLLRRENY